MVRNINTAHDEDEFKRLRAIKDAIGGSWEQVQVQAFEALAEQEDVEVNV